MLADEKYYLADLKRAMTSFSTLPRLTESQEARQSTLQHTLANLLGDFPELTSPTAPVAQGRYTSSPSTEYPFPNGGDNVSFFIPPRTAKVLDQLVVRVGKSGDQALARSLVEHCRNVWGVSDGCDKEADLQDLISIWSESIGTLEEKDCGRNLVTGIQDYCSDLEDDEPLGPTLDELLDNLLSMLSTSISSIFPTSSVPPTPPPPSLIPILSSTPHLLSHTKAVSTCSNLADELKAGSIGEYVLAVSSMMGGVGQRWSRRTKDWGQWEGSDGRGIRESGELDREGSAKYPESMERWNQVDILSH